MANPAHIELETLYPHSELAVFFPSRDRHGESCECARYANACAKILSRHVGGGYEASVRGFWLSPETGSLVREENLRLVSVGDAAQIRACIPDVIDILTSFAIETDQYEVLLVIDGHARLLSQESLRRRCEGEPGQ